MEYRIIRTEDLEHGLFGNKSGAKKGSVWKNHKYIAKQKSGDGWRYFYSQAELAAAKAKKSGQKMIKNVKRNAADLGRSISRSTDTLTTRAYEAVGDFKVDAKKAKKKFVSAVDNVKNEVYSKFTTMKKIAKRGIDSALDTIGSLSFKQFTKNASKTVEQGKQFVEDVFSGRYGYLGVVYQQKGFFDRKPEVYWDTIGWYPGSKSKNQKPLTPFASDESQKKIKRAR